MRPVAAHYGSFNGEQRTLAAGDGFVDLSHRGVVRVSGPERLTCLHSMTTQHLEHLPPGVPTSGWCSHRNGHVEHAFYGVDDGEAFTAHVEPGEAAPLVAWLDRMRFMMRVEVEDVTEELAVAWRPVADSTDPAGATGKYDVFPRSDLEKYAEAAGPACGMWAFEALRIARGEPRLGLDTDHRTIPNEMGWIPSAVHLDKGCYRGQETVARVHTLGRPPRRLTLLHLDGSDNRLPTRGAPGCSTASARSASSAALPVTTSWARSRWRCSSATCRWTRSSTPTAWPPRRRSWSTPRSACTCARCAERAIAGIRRTRHAQLALA